MSILLIMLIYLVFAIPFFGGLFYLVDRAIYYLVNKWHDR